MFINLLRHFLTYTHTFAQMNTYIYIQTLFSKRPFTHHVFCFSYSVICILNCLLFNVRCVLFHFFCAITKANGNPLNTSSICLWKVWAALRNPNGILVNSKSPKGVVIAVFLYLPLLLEFGSKP